MRNKICVSKKTVVLVGLGGILLTLLLLGNKFLLTQKKSLSSRASFTPKTASPLSVKKLDTSSDGVVTTITDIMPHKLNKDGSQGEPIDSNKFPVAVFGQTQHSDYDLYATVGNYVVFWALKQKTGEIPPETNAVLTELSQYYLGVSSPEQGIVIPQDKEGRPVIGGKALIALRVIVADYLKSTNPSETYSKIRYLAGNIEYKKSLFIKSYTRISLEGANTSITKTTLNETCSTTSLIDGACVNQVLSKNRNYILVFQQPISFSIFTLDSTWQNTKNGILTTMRSVITPFMIPSPQINPTMKAIFETNSYDQKIGVLYPSQLAPGALLSQITSSATYQYMLSVVQMKFNESCAFNSSTTTQGGIPCGFNIQAFGLDPLLYAKYLSGKMITNPGARIVYDAITSFMSVRAGTADLATIWSLSSKGFPEAVVGYDVSSQSIPLQVKQEYLAKIVNAVDSQNTNLSPDKKITMRVEIGPGPYPQDCPNGTCTIGIDLQTPFDREKYIAPLLGDGSSYTYFGKTDVTDISPLLTGKVDQVIMVAPFPVIDETKSFSPVGSAIAATSMLTPDGVIIIAMPYQYSVTTPGVLSFNDQLKQALITQLPDYSVDMLNTKDFNNKYPGFWGRGLRSYIISEPNNPSNTFFIIRKK